MKKSKWLLFILIFVLYIPVLGKSEDSQFEYTTERILRADAPNGDTYIDMETGNVYYLPANLNGNKDTMLTWLKENSIDLSVSLHDKQTSCIDSIETYMLRTANEKWNSITLEEIYSNQELQQGQPGFGNITKKKDNLPATYLCKTSQNRIGLFQIVSFLGKSNDLRIRYKILSKNNILKKKITRHMQKILDQIYYLERILADSGYMRSLPDANDKLAEYKQKLEQLKNQSPKTVSPELGKQRQQQWEQFRQLHGGKEKQAYASVRSAVSEVVVFEAIESDIEPFVKLMSISSGQIRKRMMIEMGLDTEINSDELWLAYKKWVIKNKKTIQGRLQKIIEKYNAPEAIVEHARWDLKKEYYGFGYKYLIDLFSQEKMQETQKELEKLEAELAEYN
jgi:hypothetical protein